VVCCDKSCSPPPPIYSYFFRVCAISSRQEHLDEYAQRHYNIICNHNKFKNMRSSHHLPSALPNTYTQIYIYIYTAIINKLFLEFWDLPASLWCKARTPSLTAKDIWPETATITKKTNTDAIT